jgi:hypothetical protein
MRPLLIGQAPGPNTDPDFPLFPVPAGSTGGRLQALMDITRGRYLKDFDRVNVLRHFPGKYEDGDKFPLTKARVAADAMRTFLAGRVVIFVGRQTATAFGLDPEWAWHTWRDIHVKRRCAVQHNHTLARAAVVPHPSGRSRWYNEEGNRAQARAFWQNVLESLPRLASEGCINLGGYLNQSSTLLLSCVAAQGISSLPAAPVEAAA